MALEAVVRRLEIPDIRELRLVSHSLRQLAALRVRTIRVPYEVFLNGLSTTRCSIWDIFPEADGLKIEYSPCDYGEQCAVPRRGVAVVIQLISTAPAAANYGTHAAYTACPVTSSTSPLR